MIHVSFTEDEARVLRVMLETGLKTIGGSAAKAYVVLNDRIIAAEQKQKSLPEIEPPKPNGADEAHLEA